MRFNVSEETSRQETQTTVARGVANQVRFGSESGVDQSKCGLGERRENRARLAAGGIGATKDFSPIRWRSRQLRLLWYLLECRITGGILHSESIPRVKKKGGA